MRTLIIGLDSATWYFIKPMISQNNLPNLKNLIQKGTSGILYSTTPPMTPLAWTSIVTGVNPGKHGIYDFFSQNRKTYRIKPINNSYINRPALWDIFNAYDKKVGVVNFPLAFPPPKVDSFFISGIGASEFGNFTYPSDLGVYLKKEKYRIYPRKRPKDGVAIYLKDIQNLTAVQTKVACNLLKSESWELFCVVFMGIDWIQHYFWEKNLPEGNVVEIFYKYMDTQIGKLLQEAHQDWNIVILSDHGAQKIEGEIHLNNLLEDWGYLKRISVNKRTPKKFKERLIQSSWELGQKLLPALIKQKLKPVLPRTFRTKAQMLQSQQLRLHDIIDWEQSQAFSYGNMGKIYIHTRENYNKGIITTRSEYKKIRDELINRIKILKHPKSGELLIDQIFTREELYTGPSLIDAPDIIFTPKNNRYMIWGDFGQSWFLSTDQNKLEKKNKGKRVADHDNKGIFIITGPHIQHSKETTIQPEDITPTLLYTHGLPILKDMDGQVRNDLFKTDLVKHLPLNRIDSVPINRAVDYLKKNISDKTEEEIERRLKDLGYF